jgi:hypothetical protein
MVAEVRRVLRVREGLALAMGFLAALGGASAEDVLYIPRGSEWKFLPGTQEASAPDAAAWRQAAFDDGAWSSARAPIGYGDPGLGTDLAALQPPMRNTYGSLYLRRAFEVADASKVVELQVRASFDDGFVMWVNGQEVARANIGQPGEPTTFDGLAAGNHEGGTYETIVLPAHAGYLVTGWNVVAVHAFNVARSSNDFQIDVELVDPFGPDLTPPTVETTTPLPGSTVRALTEIAVVFSEDVQGVDAADLRINGAPAASVAGEFDGPYVFVFPQPAVGDVAVVWAEDHGIRDLAEEAANAFRAGEPWSYVLDPEARDDLVISEFQASAGALVDEDREPQDWIEILNRGAIDVRLAGWSLTDDPADPGKWVFPDLVLAFGQSIVVFASAKDRRPVDGKPLHANFKLNAAGEYLGLYSSESPRRAVHEFRPAYPEQRPYHSYGITIEGEPGYFDLPTPGKPNDPTAIFPGFTADPTATPERGFFDGSVEVRLSCATPNASIFYTTDGSEPSPTNGSAYAGPISLEGAPGKAVIPLRAAAYSETLLPSNTITHSYLFAAQVLRQPARIDGFPTTWGAVEPADYAMDPLVLNAAGATDRAMEALETLPALSIALPVADFLDARRGIYANGAQEGLAWERAASAEFIYPSGEKRDQQIDCGLRIQGGSSTDNFKSKKLSMRLLFKGDYGSATLRHRVFDDSPVDIFDTLVLDAHLNLVWTHPDHGQRVRSQYVRESLMNDLQNAMGQVGVHGRWMNLFVDGVFWGVYEVHERPDDSFSAQHFGGEKEDYDCIRHGDSSEIDMVVGGDSRHWRQTVAQARTVGNNLERHVSLADVVDLANLADYMLLNFWSGNDDWPRHNWYVSRRRADGEKWRFFSWDAEHVLKDVSINVTGASAPSGISPAEIFTPLRQSAEFRMLFADRAHRHFFNGGPLYVDPVNRNWDPEHPERNRPAALYMKRIAEIDDAIVLESARWGDVRRPGQPYTRDNEWMTELNALLRNYFPQRSLNVLNQLRAINLYPRTQAPVFNRHGGRIETGFALEMSLPDGQAGTIHYTLDGGDPRVFGSGEVSPAAIAYAGPLSLPDTVTVKARTFDGANWSALNEATFTVPAPADALRLTEIHYNPAEGESEFVEIFNAGASTVGLDGLRFSRGIEFRFTSGQTLPPGAFLVLVADPVAFRARHPEVEIGGVFVGSLDNAGEEIALADAGGQEFLLVGYDDERGWPIAADGFGRSLVPVDPASGSSHPLDWRASAAEGGSPGAQDAQPAAGGIRISELLARSAPPFEDAIEVHNPTPAAIDISGWFLSDDRGSVEALKKFRIPDGTVVPAGGFRVFYENQFNAAPGGAASFALDGGGEAVYLSSANAAGELTGFIAEARYHGAAAGTSFGAVETSEGVDMAPLLTLSFGVDNPPTVEAFREGNGAPNAEPRIGEALIHEIHYHPLAPSGDIDEFIELYNPSGSPLPLHDDAQGRGWRLSGIQGAFGGDFEFGPGAVVPSRGFLLVVRDDPAAFRGRHGLPGELPIAGPYAGALDNAGETLRLERPDGKDAGGDVVYALADLVRYGDGGNWPAAADGGGPSLERITAAAYGNEPLNWDASKRDGGTPGAPNSVSSPDGNRPPLAAFVAAPASGSAPLAVSFDASAASDPDGDPLEFFWSFGDGAAASGVKVDHVYTAAGVFTARLTVRDPKGGFDFVSQAIAVAPDERGGLQVPGDINQDGRLNLSDAVGLLGHLFQNQPATLPCEGGTVADEGNRSLLDANGDARVNLTDPVYVLDYLFRGGPMPVLGVECVRIAGCGDVCAR